ncbi:MAG: hypothetical protein LBG15_14010 [Dysgonamonadaceae bacterium]|jgi:hypothetical protein|nr:hypothetical protein [Dysgonamonadaceae bacterium]
MGKITRKNFLRTFGTLLAGGGVAGVTGIVADKGFKPVYDPTQGDSADALGNYVSPYRQIASFGTDGTVEAFEEFMGDLYIATKGKVYVTDIYGEMKTEFANILPVRDMAVDGEGIWLLHPKAVQLLSHDGTPVRGWEACSDLSDYCSLALAGEHVFVTDKENKNIVKYTREGVLIKFIDSPNRFIIPSLTFGISFTKGMLYCSNSGRHQIEKYTLDGEYQGCFGMAGSKPGAFCGCCNPVHLTCTETGEIITSEKGIPRISCFSADGVFRSILLDSKALGGGFASYETKISGDKIFAAGKNKITYYRYDSQFAAVGACADCGVECPLRF